MPRMPLHIQLGRRCVLPRGGRVDHGDRNIVHKLGRWNESDSRTYDWAVRFINT